MWKIRKYYGKEIECQPLRVNRLKYMYESIYVNHKVRTLYLAYNLYCLYRLYQKRFVWVF